MSEVALSASWRDYLEMCKPRVVVLMLLCAVVGMYLATPGLVPVNILFFGSIGIALVAGSAAVVNHIADQHIDAQMARTEKRPVATGVSAINRRWCSPPLPGSLASPYSGFW